MKQEILTRAFEEASKNGLEGVTIGQLADDLGLSKAGVYGHFGSKERLQVGIVSHAAQVFLQRVIEPTLRDRGKAPRVARLFKHWLGWYRRAPALPGCFFVGNATEVDDHPGEVRETFVGEMQRMMALIEDFVRSDKDDGVLDRSTEPSQFAFEMYGIILSHHNADRLLLDKKADRRAKEAFAMLLARHTP